MHSPLRTALFVPGTRPERFPKALAAGADAVIIDLEDAVEPSRKGQAREAVVAFARDAQSARFLLRCNGADTDWFDDDLAACAELDAVEALLLPKAESAEQLQRAARAGKPVIPIVESAKGVMALAEMASHSAVQRLSFGSLDLMLDLGITPNTDAAAVLLDHVRCQILLHGRASGLQPPLDGVHPDFADLDGLARVAGHARAMGFAGMLCIHPKQIPVIHEAFAPTAAEREWAGRVVAQAAETGLSAFQLDGQMVDEPVIERARRLLAAVGSDR